MNDTAEVLSLSDIESLVIDLMRRIGVAPEAAVAVAWSVARCECLGARSLGLARLPRLIEGLRTGAISRADGPRLRDTYPGLVEVDALQGLSDTALKRGIEAVTQVAKARGNACLRVRNAGDRPAALPWLGLLRERGVDAVEQIEAVPNWPVLGAASQDVLFLEPENAQLSIKAATRAPMAAGNSGSRQDKAHVQTVCVPSDVLMRILEA